MATTGRVERSKSVKIAMQAWEAEPVPSLPVVVLVDSGVEALVGVDLAAEVDMAADMAVVEGASGDTLVGLPVEAWIVGLLFPQIHLPTMPLLGVRGALPSMSAM
jgi:hypothetical protein